MLANNDLITIAAAVRLVRNPSAKPTVYQRAWLSALRGDFPTTVIGGTRFVSRRDLNLIGQIVNRPLNSRVNTVLI